LRATFRGSFAHMHVTADFADKHLDFFHFYFPFTLILSNEGYGRLARRCLLTQRSFGKVETDII
jgi:hypothetical protein